MRPWSKCPSGKGAWERPVSSVAGEKKTPGKIFAAVP